MRAIPHRASTVASRDRSASRRRAERVSTTRRHRGVAIARAVAPTYEKVFDERTGQDVDVLSQSVERVELGQGVTWAYRRGVAAPKEGATARETPVVFAHGLGSRAYGFRAMSRELQENGFETYAVDVTGHGDSSKPAVGKGLAAYDAAATGAAMEAFLEKIGLANDRVDLILHGFVIPQHLLLLVARRPELFRRVVILNSPLAPSHAYPPQMATYTRPFGMGKGAPFDAAGYLYNGNEFALPGDVLAEYEKPYVGAEAEAARAAAEAYVTKSSDLKKLNAEVKNALSARGLPKIRGVWGTADRYLDDAPIYDWCADIRASFSAMRKVGHCPHEDFAAEAAARCQEFFLADLRASAKAALNSVRVGKITTDDGQG